jgi:hypothetical protein
VAHGGEDAFNRVCRSDVFSMLGWEVIKCQQHITIFDQLLDCPLVFHAIGFHKDIKGCRGLFLRLCRLLPAGHACMPERADVMQPCLGLFMHWLWHRARDVGPLMDTAALFFRRRV